MIELYLNKIYYKRKHLGTKSLSMGLCVWVWYMYVWARCICTCESVVCMCDSYVLYVWTKCMVMCESHLCAHIHLWECNKEVIFRTISGISLHNLPFLTEFLYCFHLNLQPYTNYNKLLIDVPTPEDKPCWEREGHLLELLPVAMGAMFFVWDPVKLK